MEANGGDGFVPGEAITRIREAEEWWRSIQPPSSKIYRRLISSPPKYLYKYVTSESAVRFLNSFKLRIPQPEVLDDPMEKGMVRDQVAKLFEHYEGGPFLLLDVYMDRRYFDDVERIVNIRETYRKRGLSLLDEVVVCQSEAWRADYKYELGVDPLKKVYEEKVSVLSLSLSADPAATVLWSYYGKNHTGVAIGLKSRDPFFRQNRRMPGDGFLGPVVYASLEEDFLRYLWPAERSMIKDPQWRDQKEWRLLQVKDSREPDYPDDGNGHPLYLMDIPPHLVDHVIFGVSTTQEAKDEILQVIESMAVENRPKIYQAIYNYGREFTYREISKRTGANP